jgi:hypothetical protein
LAVRTTARSPGRTAYRFTSRRTAVDSITPGTSLPANTYGRSISPAATTSVPALALTSRSVPSVPRSTIAIQLPS